jgi:ribosomal protein L24E
MVCFCDIPIGDLGIHIKKYGQFGLAFKKSFLIERGANPVLYVERNSAVTYLCESKDNKRRKIPLKQNISMKWLISIKIAAKPFLDIRDP